MNRYSALFKDGSKFSLYGSDYFSDKAVFYRQHYSNLIAFSVEVAEKGFPIYITDNETEELLSFDKMESFCMWFENNQAKDIDFGFGELNYVLEIENECYKRTDRLVSFILQEIKELKSEREFNPWRIDGGYKILDMTCKVAIVSIKKFESRTNLASDKLTIFKKLFAVPKDLIEYSKTFDKIQPEKLIQMCKFDLELILEFKKNLESTKSWWRIWK
jgi:hypothetical protein